MEQNEKWLNWAVELQSLAQAGLFKPHGLPALHRAEHLRDALIPCDDEKPVHSQPSMLYDSTSYYTQSPKKFRTGFEGRT